VLLHAKRCTRDAVSSAEGRPAWCSATFSPEPGWKSWSSEKHADFLRDFRGDTIHPSTLEVMHELGILDAFLQRPHSETRHLDAQVGDARLTVADFSHLPTRCKFLAFMPQCDFLNLFAEQAERYPTFHLKMQAEVTELIQNGGRITGVRANTRRVCWRFMPI
jgi:2-polyprenyl-6-methoxyphenol hydroxylase-like FAD-dependent oxidoreductase